MCLCYEKVMKKIVNPFRDIMENGTATKVANNKFENFKGFFKPKTDSLKEKISKKGSKEGSKDAPAEPVTKTWRGYFKTAANTETANKALLGLFLYSCLMFFLPLGVFFGSKQLLEDYEYEPPMSTIAPAILAIVTVNIVIILYVIKAFKEEKIASAAAAAEENKNK